MTYTSTTMDEIAEIEKSCADKGGILYGIDQERWDDLKKRRAQFVSFMSNADNPTAALIIKLAMYEIDSSLKLIALSGRIYANLKLAGGHGNIDQTKASQQQDADYLEHKFDYAFKKYSELVSIRQKAGLELRIG